MALEPLAPACVMIGPPTLRRPDNTERAFGPARGVFVLVAPSAGAGRTSLRRNRKSSAAGWASGPACTRAHALGFAVARRPRRPARRGHVGAVCLAPVPA